MLKFLIEIGPLIAFFIGYKTGDILNATIYTLIASIIGLGLSYAFAKKINGIMLISVLLLIVSATLTVVSGNSIFIKMKPTILYCIFAGILFVTMFTGSPAIKYALGDAIYLKEEKNWRQLNMRCMLFFIFMAIINELIWRFFGEDTWVNFKVFGAIPLTLLFVLLQIPYIMRHKKITPED